MSEGTAEHSNTFQSQPLKSLISLDEMIAMHPTVDAVLESQAGEGYNRLYSVCGRGERSSLRILKQGVAVAERINRYINTTLSITYIFSRLPSEPVAVWSIKANTNDMFDKFVILSMNNSTLVGVYQGDKVEMTKNTGFLLVILTQLTLLNVYLDIWNHLHFPFW